jgi:hypothetical protein
MKTGVLIYAHNNRSVDYAVMAIISGGLAKKHLSVPASLVTDPSTMEWMRESGILEKATTVFENIIIVDRPNSDNQRRLHDGKENAVVPFLNSNRASAYELTPYDRTLLIDSDYLIFSNRLGEYWNVAEDIMIGESINDVYNNSRLGYHDRYISDVGVKLYWATTVMFSKSETSKVFFNTVNFIKDNYQQFADIFRFDSRQFRNDIAFSIAKHILDGYETDTTLTLPPILSILDKDVLLDVSTSGKLTMLISTNLDSNYIAAAATDLDIHIMNKQSLIRQADKLLEIK